MGTLLKSEEEEKLEQQVSQYQTVKTGQISLQITMLYLSTYYWIHRSHDR